MSTMTVSEVAEELGVPHQWVLNRINRRKIKAQKRGGIWLIKRSSIEKLKKLPK